MFVSPLKDFTGKMDAILILSLYEISIVVAVAILLDLISITGDSWAILIIPIVLGLFLLYDIVSIIMDVCRKIRTDGWLSTLIWLSKGFAFVFTVFSLVLLIINVPQMGH